MSTPLVRLGRLPGGSLEVPKAWDRAGWYDGGPRPGQPGPAVILGHVDSTSGPAVFYRLDQLRPGDLIRVGLADSRTSFQVRRIARYPKDKFPAEAVYFPTLNRELRLITCGGQFDHALAALSRQRRGLRDADLLRPYYLGARRLPGAARFVTSSRLAPPPVEGRHAAQATQQDRGDKPGHRHARMTAAALAGRQLALERPL